MTTPCRERSVPRRMRERRNRQSRAEEVQSAAHVRTGSIKSAPARSGPCPHSIPGQRPRFDRCTCRRSVSHAGLLSLSATVTEIRQDFRRGSETATELTFCRPVSERLLLAPHGRIQDPPEATSFTKEGTPCILAEYIWTSLPARPGEAVRGAYHLHCIIAPLMDTSLTFPSGRGWHHKSSPVSPPPGKTSAPDAL
mgnify:CR=1 FL=1